MARKGKTRERIYKGKAEQYGETPYWVLIVSNMDALAISITKDKRRNHGKDIC